ncbi:MAG: hypothetical protein EBU90_20695 [Proteobacteria bacterium]|nr:hypothetical protein [Pseudomonadota bacterium]
MNNFSKIMAQCATLGPLGRLPASGTWGALCALPVALACAHYWWYPLFTVVNFYGAKFIIDQALPFFKEKDPREIILDESVGCLVIFVFIPLTSQAVILGFLAFRFFDITKWCGVAEWEKIPGAVGIIADDYFAALLAAIVVRLWLFICAG